MTDIKTNARRPPPSRRACAYVEQEIDAWIKARIRGEEWRPGPVPDRPVLIRKKEVLRRVGLSDPSLWHLERQGKFPKRIQLTEASGDTGYPRPRLDAVSSAKFRRTIRPPVRQSNAAE